MQTIVGLVASAIGVALPLSPVLMAELLSASTQLYAPRQDVVVTSKLNDLVRGPAPSKRRGAMRDPGSELPRISHFLSAVG
jgi:hypothetical protein